MLQSRNGSEIGIELAAQPVVRYVKLGKLQWWFCGIDTDRSLEVVVGQVKDGHRALENGRGDGRRELIVMEQTFFEELALPSRRQGTLQVVGICLEIFEALDLYQRSWKCGGQVVL